MLFQTRIGQIASNYQGKTAAAPSSNASDSVMSYAKSYSAALAYDLQIADRVRCRTMCYPDRPGHEFWESGLTVQAILAVAESSFEGGLTTSKLAGLY